MKELSGTLTNVNLGHPTLIYLALLNEVFKWLQRDSNPQPLSS